MAQRRPITDHPAFAPLLALWFAALFGLAEAVLPAALVESLLERAGAGALLPLTLAGRVVLGLALAVLGGLLGYVLARLVVRRAQHDPRPVYAEPEQALPEDDHYQPTRRPLRVREELDEGFPEVGGAAEPESPVAASGADAGFMILRPQAAHPPRPAPDLEALLAHFDDALAAFRTGDEPHSAPGTGRPDPVHAFVARQTGSPAPGGEMPDHQAELRAALDKLAKAHRKDD